MVSRLAFTAGVFLFRSAARRRRAAKERKETASQENDSNTPQLQGLPKYHPSIHQSYPTISIHPPISGDVPPKVTIMHLMNST